MNNPKFNQKIQRNIIAPQMNQQISSGYAIILSYDAEANTANVQMSEQGSTLMGQIYTNVICPTTIGVQAVAPEIGRPCWIDFKGNNGSDYFPVITHFFNHQYYNIDYPRQALSVNNTPRYILGI